MQPVPALCILFAVVSIASVITVVCVAIIALGSSGVFTPSKSPTTETTTTSSTTVLNVTTTIATTTQSNTPSVSLLNDASIYPNGSVSAKLSSFTAAPSTLTPLPISQSALSEIGGVDNSSTIAEAGRVQYLYVQLPNSTSNASNRLMPISTVKRNAERANSARLTIGTEVVTGIAIHFGSIGSDDSVILIPMPDVNNTSNQTSGGVFLNNLIDGSVIVRIDISIPTALCPSYNGQPIDACLSIMYQVYTVVNYNQITSALVVDIQLACGDVCSLPSGLCAASCTTCDGQQVAGYNTPVTRRYDMGSSMGSFQFFYNTFFIQDRITVWNGGKLIFDTGCVGANGTLYLNYSSTSSSIRVDVEPDCACTSPYGCGTVWYFTVYCLNSTTTQRSIISNNRISNDETVNLSLSDKTDIERRLYTSRYKP